MRRFWSYLIYRYPLKPRQETASQGLYISLSTLSGITKFQMKTASALEMRRINTLLASTENPPTPDIHLSLNLGRVSIGFVNGTTSFQKWTWQYQTTASDGGNEPLSARSQTC